MLFRDLYTVAGARNGPEAWVRSAPCGDYAHGGGRIFFGTSGQARRTGGGHARRKIYGLSDSAGQFAAEFSARQRFADRRAPRAPRNQVQYFRIADSTRSRRAASGRDFGA